MDYRSAPPAAPPSYAIVSRVYTKSLRPVVAGITAFAAIYAAIWAISAFNDIGDDRQHISRLVVFDVVLGILYVIVLAIEALGIAASWLQRLPLVRLYAFGSLLAALLVMGAEMLRIVVHFVFKSTIIDSCIKEVTNSGDNCKDGRCNNDDDQPLSFPQGQAYCNAAFNRATFASIGWFIAVTIVGWLFASIALGYLHQIRTVGVRVPVPQQQHFGMQNFAPERPYDPPNYPPPPGPPPTGPLPHSAAPPYQMPTYGASTANFGDDKAPGYEFSIGAGADGKHGGSDGKHSPFEGGHDSHREGGSRNDQDPFRG